MKLKVNRIIPATNVEGPGTRFCIYVQGCNIRCTGCANKELWDFDGGTDMETSEIISEIKKAEDRISGITFLGGEPTCQAQALCEIAEYAQNNSLNTLLFSGYTYNELLECKNPYVKKLLTLTDLLIDGKYDISKVDYSRPWIGSSNQNYVFLSDIFNFEDISKYNNALEVRITSDGIVFVNGMGNYEKIKNILNMRGKTNDI